MAETDELICPELIRDGKDTDCTNTCHCQQLDAHLVLAIMARCAGSYEVCCMGTKNGAA